MFTGFTDDTVRFFLDLKFHNERSFFLQQHDRYVRDVQEPFYQLIEELGGVMKEIDPLMETRPFKCLSRIHRDTRFSRDKSPYRDHLWFLFRRAAEPREKSLFYYFEFGVNHLGWGMGIWGENREMMDRFRRQLVADPDKAIAVLKQMELEKHHFYPDGRIFRRMTVPADLPPELETWYRRRELYIGKAVQDPGIVYTRELLPALASDFRTLVPLYRMLRAAGES